MSNSPATKYHRILLKISGEFLKGPTEFGIDPETIGKVADEIAEIVALGVEVGLVVGGGNIVRGAEVKDMNRAAADYIGMLATMINALTLQGKLEIRGVATRVLSAIEMRELAEPYIRRRAIRHLERGEVVIFGCGTGNPFFTTDTAAALRANEIGADVLMKATNVDGVYDDDPRCNSCAKRFETLSYNEVVQRNLRVMDTSAVALCRENNLPILVFDLSKPGNIMRAVMGETIGTLVNDGAPETNAAAV